METRLENIEEHERLCLSELWQSMFSEFSNFLAPRQEATSLDLECRTGHLTCFLGNLTSSIIGLESSLEFLTRAELNRARLGLLSVTFQQQVGNQLPFRDGTFDLVSAFNALAHAVDLPRELAEIHRVMRKGGILGGMLASSRAAPYHVIKYAQSVGLTEPESDALLKRLQISSNRLTERDLERLLLGAGFRAVRSIEQLGGLILFVKAWR